MLKTVAFHRAERKLAACHYYACYPMSYYGDGGPWYIPTAEAYPRRAKKPCVTHCYARLFVHWGTGT